MKPTQQEIIELAREAGVDRYTKSDYCAGPYWAATDAEIERLVHLALERFGAGGGEPVAWLNPYGGVVQVRATGHEKEHFTIPLYTQPSPTDLRAEYLRGLEDAKRVALDADHMGSVNLKLMKNRISNAIEALKGKQ